MTAFMKGEVRKVDVPSDEVKGTELVDLDRIYYWGQNDFQPVEDRCSVSAGDVIQYKGSLYIVKMAGFAKISKAQFEQIKNDEHAKIELIFQ